MIIRVTGFILTVFAALLIVSCENEQGLEFKRYYSQGAEIYQTHCQNCHGVNGQGLLALVPPVNDSVYLKNNKASLACYIRSGLKGVIVVNGKTFDDAMPANDLSPMQIAQVLTYVTNSFGNKLGTINKEKTELYLKNCR
jgi:mono/diheme cytochrome c family protein